MLNCLNFVDGELKRGMLNFYLINSHVTLSSFLGSEIVSCGWG